MFDLYYNIKDGIANLWYFRKVVWNTRWWDFYFTLEWQKARLEYMLKHWDKSMYVGWEDDKNLIQQTLELCELLIQDSFMENEMVFIEEKYGKCEMEDRDDNHFVLLRNGINYDGNEEYEKDYKEAINKSEAFQLKVEDEFYIKLRKVNKLWD